MLNDLIYQYLSLSFSCDFKKKADTPSPPEMTRCVMACI